MTWTCFISPAPVWRPGDRGDVYLEGTWSEGISEHHPGRSRAQELFKQFSFPGGISSHVAPTTPWVDPRRRRVRLFAQPRLWSRIRQSPTDRRLRHRRRRAETGLGDAWQSNEPANPDQRRGRVPILHAQWLQISTRPSSPAFEHEELASFCAAAAGRPTLSRRRAGKDASTDGHNPREGHRGHKANPKNARNKDAAIRPRCR